MIDVGNYPTICDRTDGASRKSKPQSDRLLGFMVMPRTAQRPDRISLRLSPQAKRKLERAAAYSDKTLTDFVLDVALQKADAIVREHEVITLSTEEWERFQALLLHPPKPNKKLKQTLAWYRQVARD
jgi:uncharacterized protein (DUF1778 family)